MAKKMPRRMVALSSSAIAAIYFAGFIATRAADAGLAQASSTAPTSVTPQTASATVGTTAPTPVVSESASPTVRPSATATPTTTSASTSGYADGIYTGTGTSRRGNVSVSLTVQNGQVANVTITGITTQYPVSRIASLPAQVISRQSTQVDNVSGATYSAQAFSTAVQQALAMATA